MALVYRAARCLHSAPTRYPVTVGDPLVITSPDGRSLPHPLLIQADPGAGGTLTVETRAAETAAWVAWPSGSVSAATQATLDAPCQAIRATAATTAGALSIGD